MTKTSARSSLADALIKSKKLTCLRTREIEPQIARHISHVGEIIYAWNRTHAAAFRLFSRIIAPDNQSLALGLWHAIRDDKTQRVLLAQAASNLPVKFKSYREAVLWAVGALDLMATHRNDATHAEMMVLIDLDTGEEVLAPGTTNKTALIDRLEAQPIASNWSKVRGDLVAMCDYLTHIEISYVLDMPRPWTNRPVLQSVRFESARSQARRHRAKKAARERQRRSSPK